MMRTIFVVCTLLPCVATPGWCTEAEPVYGPPKLLVNARIDQRGPRESERFVASFLVWEESRQNWDRPGKAAGPDVPDAYRGVTISVKRSRAIFVLQSEQLVMSMNALTFSRLDGEPVASSDVAKILEAKRAVAFVPKGCTIHPAIAAALHPDTLVVSRRSYPEEPILIPLPETR